MEIHCEDHISPSCLHVYPQFTYESFHIHYIISLLSRENMNSQLTSLPICGFIAQLVEHRTGIAEVTGSNPVEALIFFFFFRLLYSNCLYWKFTAKIIYSYFEKRCRKKSTKLHKPISKGSMGRRIELLHVLNTNEI